MLLNFLASEMCTQLKGTWGGVWKVKTTTKLQNVTWVNCINSKLQCTQQKVTWSGVYKFKTTVYSTPQYVTWSGVLKVKTTVYITEHDLEWSVYSQNYSVHSRT